MAIEGKGLRALKSSAIQNRCTEKKGVAALNPFDYAVFCLISAGYSNGDFGCISLHSQRLAGRRRVQGLN